MKNYDSNIFDEKGRSSYVSTDNYEFVSFFVSHSHLKKEN